MKKPTSTPHDAVFKTYLSHPDTARDFLQLYLPETLLKVCDLRTLHLESGHFVEDDMPFTVIPEGDIEEISDECVPFTPTFCIP